MHKNEIFLLLIVLSAAIGSPNEELFVFPSMQMEELAQAAKEDKSYVPMVEVIFRGQPPQEEKITSTTVSSREVITQTTKGKLTFY